MHIRARAVAAAVMEVAAVKLRRRWLATSVECTVVLLGRTNIRMFPDTMTIISALLVCLN